MFSLKLREYPVLLWQALKKDKLLTVAIIILLIWIFSGYVAYHLELLHQGSSIRSLWDGFYWSVVTFTTTGYGD